jgi:6-phosphogluconolactonase (cycloisomerase 2 family)
MKRTVLKAGSLLFALALFACSGGGGGGGDSTGTGGGTGGGGGGGVGTTPRFAFVANDDNTVSMYSVEAATGRLRHLRYHTAGAGIPRAVVVDSTGRFVYTANSSSIPGADGNVSFFSIDPVSGEVTGATAFNTGLDTFAMAIDPLNRFLYVLNMDSHDISAFTIDPSTGVLSVVAGSPFVLPGLHSSSIVIEPGGKFLYAAEETGDTNPDRFEHIAVMSIDPTTGALTSIPGSPFAAVGGALGALAVHPSGKLLYLSNPFTNDVAGFSLDPATGTLTPIDADPNTAGVQNFAAPSPGSMAFDVSGKFLYVASAGIAEFIVDPSTGFLTPVDADPNAAGIENFATPGVGPYSITVNPTNGFAYVVNEGSDDVTIFAIDPVTGAPTAFDTIRARVLPVSLAFSFGTNAAAHVPSFAYVVDAGSNQVSAYSIDPVSGTLVALGAPVDTGAGPNSVAVAPSGKLAYVANSGSNDISAYTIDFTGLPAPIDADPNTAGVQNFAAAAGPFSIAIDSSERFVYAADSSGGAVSAYQINTATGAMVAMSGRVLAGTNPHSITIDPTGQFVFVANFGSNDVSAYMIEPIFGALTPVDANTGTPTIDNFPAGTGPFAVAVHPSGKFAYVANSNSNSVSAYTIGTSATARGALIPIDADPNTAGVQNFPAGPFPVALAFDPSGKYLYVTNDTATNNLTVLAIDPNTGALSPLSGSPFSAGDQPFSVCIDPSGKFAYAANSSSSSVSAWTIDPGTGTLTAIDADPGTAGVQGFPTGPTPVSVITVGKIQ